MHSGDVIAFSVHTLQTRVDYSKCNINSLFK